jgi:hypothetical protein
MGRWEAGKISRSRALKTRVEFAFSSLGNRE